jgi:sorbitol-specific phosphotransferase system component IIBC
MRNRSVVVDRALWGVLVGLQVVSWLIFRLAYYTLWWLDAQRGIGLVSVGVCAWMIQRKRPRVGTAFLMLACVAVGQFHSIVGWWASNVWHTRPYMP